MEFTLEDLTPNKNFEEYYFPYNTGQVAAMLDHPKVNGKIKLRNFLRQYSVFVGDLPAQEYVALKYFRVQQVSTHLAGYYPPFIMVSEAGVAFIKELIENYLINNNINK